MKTIIAAVLLFTAQTAFAQESISKMEWLVGTWEQDRNRNTYEAWAKTESGSLEGMVYTVNGTDTLITETIMILEDGDTVYYIPVVSNQNDGLPVRFSLAKLADNEMTFENRKHDFPQFIKYKLLDSEHLMAEIWAVEGEDVKTIQFPMRRVK